MNVIPTAEKKIIFTGHNAAIYTVCDAPGEDCFFSGSADKYVAWWNLASGQQEKFAIKMPAAVYSLCYLKHCQQLWIGTGNGHIHVVDLNERKEIHAFRFHQLAVFAIRHNEASGLVYSSGADGLLNVYDPVAVKHLHSLKVSEKKVRSIDFHEDKLLLGDANGNIQFLDRHTLVAENSFAGHKDATNCFWVNEEQGTVLSGGRDAHLNLWDLKNNFTRLQSIPAHNFAIYSILPLTGTPFLATASRDKTIKLWNKDTLHFELRINRENYNGHTHSVNTLLWDQKNNLLVSGSDDRTIIAWQINNVQH